MKQLTDLISSIIHVRKLFQRRRLWLKNVVKPGPNLWFDFSFGGQRLWHSGRANASRQRGRRFKSCRVLTFSSLLCPIKSTFLNRSLVEEQQYWYSNNNMRSSEAWGKSKFNMHQWAKDYTQPLRSSLLTTFNIYRSIRKFPLVPPANQCSWDMKPIWLLAAIVTVLFRFLRFYTWIAQASSVTIFCYINPGAIIRQQKVFYSDIWRPCVATIWTLLRQF